MYDEKIKELVSEGLSNVEISRKLEIGADVVCKIVKKHALQRTPEQKSAIKSRAQLGTKYKKKSKYKSERNRVSTYESKNYILDDIRKGLINTDDLEADIKTAVASIQKLRANFAKIPKFEKNE